jgi:cell wall-associated NlpC family hydrolase
MIFPVDFDATEPYPRTMSKISFSLAQRVAVTAVLALLAHAVMAAPEAVPVAAEAPRGDVIGRLPIEKGWVVPGMPSAADDNALVEKVRNKASDMVLTAMNFLGVPYRRGGSSAEHGFDCSGFTRQVFETSLGVVLPRRVDQQAGAPGLAKIKRDELQPGDLVFFNTLRRTFSHVGIYVGDGKFIHSPRPGGEVRVEDMRFAYWAKRFSGARRAEPIGDQAATHSALTAPIAASNTTRVIR